MIHDTPVSNWTDAWLREMREMEAESYGYEVPVARLPSIVTRAALEAEAALARAALGEVDAGAVQATRRVQRGDEEALLGWLAI